MGCNDEISKTQMAAMQESKTIDPRASYTYSGDFNQEVLGLF